MELLKGLCVGILRNQLQSTLKNLHANNNNDELHCMQLLNDLEKFLKHEIYVRLAFESPNRILFCMILREKVTCKNSKIKLKVLNILHYLLTLHETYIATSPVLDYGIYSYEGILLSSQSENGDIMRKIPSILIEDGLLFKASQQMNDSNPEVFCSILEFLKRIAFFQCNSSFSSSYYNRAVSVLESALRLGILNPNDSKYIKKIPEFCLDYIQTMHRIPIKQEMQIVTFFSKLQTGRKFPDKLLAAKLVAHCRNPNIKNKIEKLVHIWIDECNGKHKNYLTVQALRILLFLMKPVLSMMGENSRNHSQSLSNTQYSQSLDDSQSICSQESSVDSQVIIGPEKYVDVFLQSPFRGLVKFFLEFTTDEDKELVQVLKHVLLSNLPTTDKAGRYLELIHLLQLHDASIGIFIMSNGDFICFLEHQLTYTVMTDRATQAFKILCNILKSEKEQNLNMIPANLSGRRITMELSTLFAWLQESIVDFSHLEVLSLMLSHNLASNFICVQEVTEDREKLEEILLSFQFHVVNLLSTVPINLQDTIWGTLCELLCFVQRRVDQDLHNSEELLQRMLLQRFFEDVLFAVIERSRKQTCSSSDSFSFSTNNLLCIQRWAVLTGIQATNCQRFRSRMKRNFCRLPELIRSLAETFQQELNQNKIDENEQNLRCEVLKHLRELRNTVF